MKTDKQLCLIFEANPQWLEQRFVEKGKTEIEKMLVGQLPDLRETQSGKDLIAIGVQEGIEKGIEKGKRDSLIQVLESRFGRLDSRLLEKLDAIKGLELLDKYFRRALTIQSLDHLLSESPSPETPSPETQA
jgi:flagellar biosynthesis/type III secretory pathway protein FliH